MSQSFRSAASSRRSRHTAMPPAPSRSSPRKTVLGIYLAGALAALTLVVLGNLTRATPGSDSVSSVASVVPAATRVKGAADAPVTIIEYADMQCPNCARFALSTEPELERRYIATGKVRLEVRQFPILGAESTRAAEALECAGEQGKFWEYRTALFRNQRGENRGQFSDRNLRRIAAEAGMNTEALGACLDAGRYRDRIAEDLRAGRAAGVQGTPSFLINGRLIVGNLPLMAYTQVIDEALAAAGAGR